VKRPMRWYWATPISFVAACVARILWECLTQWGTLADQCQAPLEWLLCGYLRLAKFLIGDTGPTDYGVLPTTALQGYLYGAWFRIPFFVAALLTYAYLRRRKWSEYLRCPKCAYILKGLSEPRCPECGERI
jgi:hypothetical protein